MMRTAFSALMAIGVHVFLLSADFNLPRRLTEPPAVPDRLTVVMMPASPHNQSVAREPLPAKRQLPTPLPPPARQLLTKTDPAETSAELPEKVPDAAAVRPALPPTPKKSLKALTYTPRPKPPGPEPAQRHAAQDRLQASTQAPAASPLPASPAASPAAVDATSGKPTSVAAAHQPHTFFPDRSALPLLDRNPPPVYPSSARRRGYQGSVVLKVLVDESGKVEKVEVDQSCGYDLLDRTALSAVRDWQFQPGIRGGKKVKMWVRVPVRFVLK